MSSKLVSLLLLLLPAMAYAQPRVAVMPFKDLAGQRANIGEAIAETVTSDLRDLPGLRVVERANIDRVLGELELNAHRADLDAPATLKVGRLLSATLIVVGSYQQVGADVRINARFVDTATGEVAGSAKVDGPAGDFLKLQDRITVELLKSARLGNTQKFAARPRPKLKSLRPVELYGDSVVETDEQKKKALLNSVLEEAPTFEYAVRDLDALQKRLQQYHAAADSAELDSYRSLKERLSRASGADERAILSNQLFVALLNARRYRLLLVEARELSSHNPPTPPPSNGLAPANQAAAYYIVQAESYLKDEDAVLRDGEAFLKKFPGTLYYSSAASLVQQSIMHKHNAETGKQQLDEWLAKYGAENQRDLCNLAAVYKGFYQYRDAQRLYRGCLFAKAAGAKAGGARRPAQGAARLRHRARRLESGARRSARARAGERLRVWQLLDLVSLADPRRWLIRSSAKFSAAIACWRSWARAAWRWSIARSSRGRRASSGRWC